MSDLFEDFMIRDGGLCRCPLEYADISAIDPRHPAVLFTDYWRGLTSEGDTPSAAQFNPAKAKPCLKWLLVMDRSSAPCEDERATFVMRLAGTAAETMMQGNHTGSRLEEFTTGECYETRYMMLDHVTQTGQPAFGSADLSDDNEYNSEVFLGMFPFRGDEKRPDQVYVVVAPKEERQRLYF